MTCTMSRPVCKLVAWLLVGATAASAEGAEEFKARAGQLLEQRAEAKVTLLDGTKFRGRVLRVDTESFTIHDKAAARDRELRYMQVKEIAKSGLSRRTKAILIPVAIGGGVLLVLCAGPYPIGFLCRKDPS